MQDRSRVSANALRLSFFRKIKYRLTLPLQFGVIASALRSKKKRPCFLSTPYSWRFLQVSLYKKVNNGIKHFLLGVRRDTRTVIRSIHMKRSTLALAIAAGVLAQQASAGG
ncbi:hypothetical protein, partial [Pseudomonas citronellolis]|uniref:hypothetical protein n=1 Tax=Pseudomonas citronellolis TaxID=53408 RepID=UPI00117A75BA